MAHPYPKHLESFDYIGTHAYFLTFLTFDRTPHFTDAEAVALVHVQILRAADETGFAVAAYSFMPDHLHLLVRGERDDSDARWFIKQAKQYSGYYFSQARRGDCGAATVTNASFGTKRSGSPQSSTSLTIP